MEHLHDLLGTFAYGAIILFEFMGIVVIIFAGFKGVYNYLTKNPYTRLNLARGMAMGLEFKLGSEILRTVIVREWVEFLTVAGIIILRAALTLLIHWEINNEKKECVELENQERQYKIMKSHLEKPRIETKEKDRNKIEIK